MVPITLLVSTSSSNWTNDAKTLESNADLQKEIAEVKWPQRRYDTFQSDRYEKGVKYITFGKNMRIVGAEVKATSNTRQQGFISLPRLIRVYVIKTRCAKSIGNSKTGLSTRCTVHNRKIFSVIGE